MPQGRLSTNFRSHPDYRAGNEAYFLLQAADSEYGPGQLSNSSKQPNRSIPETGRVNNEHDELREGPTSPFEFIREPPQAYLYVTSVLRV